MDAGQFYDDYLTEQVRSGINDRIYSLYKKLLNLGLRSDDKVLEIGCGIGALTFLLAGKIKAGYLEAFDPSLKSIDYARKRISRPNVTLSPCDALSYIPFKPPFDKIILFDVLEHIPETDHGEVFKKAQSWLNDEGMIFINLPNPEYILFDKLHNPGMLQEIDQPVFLKDLLPKLVNAGLEIVRFEVSSIWVREDYHFIIARKQKAFTEQFLHLERNFFEKGMIWIKRKLRKLRYRFS